MATPANVLGQPMAGVDAPASRQLAVVVVDIDDYEVLRLARGDDWAADQRRLVEAATASGDLDAGIGSSQTFVAPDAWVVALGGDAGASLAAAAGRYAERIRVRASQMSDVTVSIGVSRVHGGPNRMEIALREAVAGVERKLIDTGDRVTVYEEARLASSEPVPARVEAELARAIRNGDVAGALEVLSSWIDRVAATEGVTPDVLRRWVLAEVMYALDVSGQRRLPDGSADWFEAFSRLSLDEIMHLSGVHDRSYLMLWLERLLDRIVDVKAPTSAGRHVLAVVEDYIQQHYDEDIKLVTVATEVFVSPYYISHLFQRERSTTFLKYLTGVRMQHARTLLARTDSPVEVISRQVGYSSPKRFRALFKGSFDVTPTDYRRRHRRN